jgi:GDP-L-fucose synthase
MAKGNISMKTILVTGADGLVGMALRALQPPNTIYITRKDADLTDFQATVKLFNKLGPTHIIHLAAEVAGIGGNLIHSGEYFRNNVMINTNVLEAARLSGVKKLISFMSTCVFPNDALYPLTPDQIHNGAPHQSNFGYAYAKRMLEVQSRAYRQEWNCNYVVAIPTNIYGPHDNWSINDGHVIPALIHKMFLAKSKEKSLQIWGSGKPLREFVYSDDIAKLALWALDNYGSEIPIVLTNSEEVSIRDIVKLIANIMKFKGKLEFDTSKPEGQFRKPSDSSILKKLYPSFTFTPIDVGLKKTVDWFIKNYPNVRNYDK